MTDSADADTADTMRGRAGGSRAKLWLLLHTNRLVVAGVLTAAVFVPFVVAVALLSPPFAQQLESTDTIDTLFSTMITVVVTGTTLVVTIGQLVLTQENGPLGDQRDRMRNSMDVRESVAEVVEAPSPTDPAAFLGELLAGTARRAERFRDAIGRTDDDALRADVDEFVDDTVENADSVREQLDDAQFGSFDVVSAGLNFDYSAKVYEVERLADEYGMSLDETATGRLDALGAALALYGPAREHVKTLYFQWALIDLSRQILYAAIPAVAVAAVMVAVVGSGTFPGRTFGVDHVVLVVGGAFAVTIVPFMLFVAYLLRILTVAKRTLAIDPLELRDTG